MNVYAYKYNDIETRKHSTSGGAFTALSDYVISIGGVVYGASLTEDFTVRHIRAIDKRTRDKMKGSKYVQSIIGDSYISVKQDIKEKRYVLFTGTPCQVAGLKKYLGKLSDSNYLYTCDIICHGVPSIQLFKDYVSYLKSKNGYDVNRVLFRDKIDYKWEDCHESAYVSNGEKIEMSIWSKLYYGHESIRPSCFVCKFTNLNRQGDITLGDYWGIDKVYPDMYDAFGVSLMLVNTDKGNDLIKKISHTGEIRESDLKYCVQPQLYKPIKKPWYRNWFWEKYRNKGYDVALGMVANNKSLYSVMKNISINVKGIIKDMLMKIRRH